MLLQVTIIVAITTMAITLWMAFYLFARGFSSEITMRAVVVLFSLSAFFFSAYNNIFHQVAGSAARRAVLLVVALIHWYGVTYHLMSDYSQRRYRKLKYAMYGIALVTSILLLLSGSFIDNEDSALHVARMAHGMPNIVYDFFQLSVSICILLNLLVDDRVGFASEGKYFLLASIFPAVSIIYGVTSLTSPAPMPRIVPDLFIFCGVFILGMSVARHQTLVERRTTFQDFPLSALTILSLSALYAFLALRWGISIESLALVVGFAVLTHSLYDLVREFIERNRIHQENVFLKQLHQLQGEIINGRTTQHHLQTALNLICRTLKSTGGFIAIRRGDEFVVTASRDSVPVESEIPLDLVTCENVSRVQGGLPGIMWIAPAFDGSQQIAVLGIGFPQTRMEYSAGNLDLLAEVTDQIGRIVSLDNPRFEAGIQIQQLVAATQANIAEMDSITGKMAETMIIDPDAEFIKMVEDGLRNLSDYIKLGQSPLAEWAKFKDVSHVERGRRLSQLIMDAIESLRPPGKRPDVPLPRVWYNYTVLYDEYVEGVQNREIMARLYISEGTFNRTRRNALRGLARILIEKKQGLKTGKFVKK